MPGYSFHNRLYDPDGHVAMMDGIAIDDGAALLRKRIAVFDSRRADTLTARPI